MFMYPLEALLALFVIGVCFLIYKRLVNSPTFNRLVQDTVHPTESDDEVVEQFDTARVRTKKQLTKAEQAVETKKKSAERLRNRVGD